VITSHQPRSGVRSRLARVSSKLKNSFLHREVAVDIDAYEVLFLPSQTRRIRFAIKGGAETTGDLVNITIPRIYEYDDVDALAFERQNLRVPGKEGEEDDALVGNFFEELKTAAVEGCVYKEVYSFPAKKRRFTLPRHIRGVQRRQGDDFNPFYLVLPSLYPESAFDFQGLLDFPAGKALFPFQREGVTFLLERENALLADEMGLGKSIQAIAAVRFLFRARVIDKCLVICPKSVLTDWSSKFEEWAPELTITKTQGSASTRRGLWARKSQVYLVTYDTLKEDVLNIEEEAVQLSFDLVILDEVQRIKNKSTQTFRAINKVGGRIRWGLSGTPLENRVEDLTTIFSYLKPGLFRAYEVGNPHYVKSAITPFTLRRTKNAVLKDLPSKTHDKVLLELGARQRAVYNMAERTGVIALKEKGKTVTVTHVMALVSKLKQICNLETASGESCKLEYVEDVLQNLDETGEKMVIFSQYPEKTLRLIKPRLQRFKPLIYQGSLTSKQREEVLKRFNEDEDMRVLLISLKAGGLGLTLTAANYVVHFDSWWNPATMSQAEDRTHRIGQTKNVFVASLITQGTVEERIQRILEEKRELFNEVVGEISDEGLTRLLSEKELFGLFGLQRAKNRSKSQDISGPPRQN
jgi:SNF2 family DNA or RNA helicase